MVVWFLVHHLDSILRLHGFCHYVAHYVLCMHTMSPCGHFLSCSEDAPCFKYPTDLQFWTGKFLNVPCGDGLHFNSSFAVCLVVYKIPCEIAIKVYNTRKCIFDKAFTIIPNAHLHVFGESLT